MTKPYSLAFKKKMVQRMTGRHAVSANQLAKETGLRQQTLSHWLREARNVPDVASTRRVKARPVAEKVRLLNEASELEGDQLTDFLERESVSLGEIERWRLALDEDGGESKAVARRIRSLERELARKEKALAEAAALLVLKKKVEGLWGEEEDDTDELNETPSSPRSRKRKPQGPE